MPFRSEKQRRYLWKHEPKIAREWTEAYGSKPVKKGPDHVPDDAIPKKKSGGSMDPYYGSYIKGRVDGKTLSNPSYRKYYKGLI